MRESAVFNNLVAHAGVAISVSGPAPDLNVDHNLYLALFTGKFNDEMARISLGPWRDVSGGLDAQSVCLPVVFRDAAKGDYQPVSTLDWNPGIPTTAGWGVKKLGDVKAPARTLPARSRPAIPGVGAREARRCKPAGNARTAPSPSSRAKAPRAPASSPATARWSAISSATCRWPKATYGFVLPSRSEQGAAIGPGDYELRLVESNLRWNYRMLTANNGVGTRVDESDRDGVWRVCFGPDNSLILAGGWNERTENIRAKDLASGKPVWSVPGGAETLGLCRGGDGLHLRASTQRNPNFARHPARQQGHLQAVAERAG